MSVRTLSALAVALSLLASAGAQLVVGSISDGNVVYTHSSFPTSISSASGLGDFSSAGQDHLYQATWYWRLADDPREYAFHGGGGQGTVSSVYSSDRVVHTWSDVDLRGFAATRDIRVAATGPTSGFAIEKLTFTNNRAEAVHVDLFAYVDYDVCQSAGGDSAAANPGPNKLRVTDGTCAPSLEAYAPGADNHEVTAFASVRTRLLDGVRDDLNNTGLPFGPGDFTAAWQWRDRTLAPGASFTCYLILGSDIAHSGCQAEASVATYGAGKSGTNGVPTFATDTPPFLGRAMAVQIENGFAGSAPCIVIGSARDHLPIHPFGTLLVSLSGAALVNGVPFDLLNRSRTPITIPNDVLLCHMVVHAQAFLCDPAAAGSVSHTAGLTWTLGGVH